MNFTRIGYLCTCNYHKKLADKYFICALKFAANKCCPPSCSVQVVFMFLPQCVSNHFSLSGCYEGQIK